MASEAPIEVIVAREAAVRSATWGAVAAILQALLTLLAWPILTKSSPGNNLALLAIDVGLTVSLGVLLYQRHSAGALGLLGLLALSTLNKQFIHGVGSGLLGAVIFGFIYYRAWRGTRTLKRLGQPGTPYSPTATEA